MICLKTMDDVVSFYWISIFYNRTKRKDNQRCNIPVKNGRARIILIPRSHTTFARLRKEEIPLVIESIEATEDNK
jgi:hypothetical protein